MGASGSGAANGNVSGTGCSCYDVNGNYPPVICPGGMSICSWNRCECCPDAADAADAADASTDGTVEPADTDVEAGLPPSCAPGGTGMTNCGPGGSGTESCCTSLEVTGGTYFRTYDLDPSGAPIFTADGGPTREADPATVSTFRLDKYVVTVGRLRQFVNARNAGWLPTPGSGKHTHLNGGNGLAGNNGGFEPGWAASDDSNIAVTDANLTCGLYDNNETWTAYAGTQENLPINCVNWYEAYAFCIWDGGFLPSDAEWEYAAAGGAQQREYPWGSTAPGTACPGTGCQYAIYNCDYPSGSGNCTSVKNIAPVGTATLGAGLWGQLDMVGDVSQWNLDGYGDAPYVDPCTDCTDLATASRVYRGVSFGDYASYLLPSLRFGSTPTSHSADTGFRCARTP